VASAAVIGCLVLLTGCKSFFDSSELTGGGNGHGDRLLVSILSSIDPRDEAETEFAGAVDVKPTDLLPDSADYVIGRNDLLTVSVFDLVNAGVESVRTARVSETGMLGLPMLPDPIQAAGLTEALLQKAVAAKYKEAGLIINAQVTVTVVEARGRTFYVYGAVPRPGQYALIDSDFRILNALVQSGDAIYPAEYLYIIRKLNSEKPTTQPVEHKPVSPTTVPTGDPLAPKSEISIGGPILAMQQPQPKPATRAAAAPTTRPAASEFGQDQKYIFIDGKPVLSGTTQPAGGQTPPLRPVTPITPTTPEKPATQTAFEFGSALNADTEKRVIRVPLIALRNGDLRFNIVVRAGDTIVIPSLVQTFYYMGGHVGQPGTFSLAGQRVSLTQAVISARMLDPFAVPAKTDIIRRIGADKQVFVRVNLEKIFEGRQPDIFLKPNDEVLVGTDFYPTFLYALKTAFRLTAGFGFIYDRNFAPAQKQQFAKP
jgi:protein involved in polysaccharide export with SLBB domain